jgi:hypothetical protein
MGSDILLGTVDGVFIGHPQRRSQTWRVCFNARSAAIAGRPTVSNPLVNEVMRLMLDSWAMTMIERPLGSVVAVAGPVRVESSGSGVIGMGIRTGTPPAGEALESIGCWAMLRSPSSISVVVAMVYVFVQW